MMPNINTRPERVEVVIQEACQQHGANRMDLLTGNRTRPYQEARRAICRRLRDEGRPLQVIGRMLNVHHSTVIYYLRQTEAACSQS